MSFKKKSLSLKVLSNLFSKYSKNSFSLSNYILGNKAKINFWN